MHHTAAVSRLLLLADEPRGARPAPSGRGKARERAEARVRRYRLARLQLDDGARAAGHAQLRVACD
jgi:hypothetical protein